MISLANKIASAVSLEDRIRIAAAEGGTSMRFSTSLGLEDQALLHAIATSKAPVDVFTLDTGRHFPETLDTIAASEQRYGLRIRVVVPEAKDLEALVARDGINGFKNSIDARKACCHARKVLPLQRALKGATSWITGLRRGQSNGRSDVPFAEHDAALGLLKLNPLADWTLERLEDFLEVNKVPVSPLHANGFPSVGCQPCTRAIRPGEDIRAGRWWWENPDHSECGLHSRPVPFNRKANKPVTEPAS